MTLIHAWTNGTYTARLSRERYGQHFSVGTTDGDRLPTDAECDSAFAGWKLGLWIEDHLTEVTSAHQALGALNPFVRHFVPDEAARRMFVMAAERTAKETVIEDARRTYGGRQEP